MEQKKKHGLFAALCMVVAILLLAVDQLTKQCVIHNLKPIGSITVIPGWLELLYTENTGAAFGLLKDYAWVVVAVTVIASICIIIALFRYRQHTFFSYAAAGLIIAGGFGNLIDRFLYGYVVDFIHVMFFDYIFNFADCCITVSAVLLVIHVLFFTKDTDAKKKKTDGEEAI